ncbi:MAG: hypothetical protein RL733_721 [Actinomycetota bacterium]
MTNESKIRIMNKFLSKVNYVIQKMILRYGYSAQRVEDIGKIKVLMAKLQPQNSGIDLIRIGGENDGGYLIPDDLKAINCCFSPGVSNSASFEEELESKYGIQSHLADFSVPGPPNGFVPKSFIGKFIGAYSENEFISFDDWIDECLPSTVKEDLIMQIDIEGGEYEAILGLSQANLNRFRIIAIEIHNIESWAQKAFFPIAESFIKKLRSNFHVVHFHPNNFAGLTNIGGTKFPRVVEVTLLRNDRIGVAISPAELPHSLDQRNSTGNPEIHYNFT